ncbi:unnamed protein product [Meloidogyne enterolobii]|uniref:Uncharacterized protein n=2 Tax=Meloidogyne enterolobii TaxID=390850 RepID=A0ACB0XVE3_MELEN|nr:unnamed protein product [Meloidogyne enterolobii]
MSTYSYEYRTTGGGDKHIPRIGNKTTSWHSSTYRSPSAGPPADRIVTEREYSWSSKPAIDSYTFTKGPYIRVEQKHQGPDYRAHLEPRPALPGRHHYTKSTNIQRKYIGGRPTLHY